MKIFFIIPPIIFPMEPYAPKSMTKNNISRPSLGLLYVAAAVERGVPGAEVRIIDCPVEGMGPDELDDIIEDKEPDFVGFSVLTFNLYECLMAAERIKWCCPKTKVIFGGWHPTLYPGETFSFWQVDYMFLGEAEETIVHFLNDQTRMLNGTIKTTQKPDTNTLPLPGYHLLDMSKYSDQLGNRSISVQTSRGCPHGCVFCDVRRTDVRLRSAQNVLEELGYWYLQGVREFYFQDDNFLIDRGRTQAICAGIRSAGLDIQFKISARVSDLNDRVLYDLNAAGCNRVHVGVESGSQRILDYYEKGVTLDQISRAFYLMHKHKITSMAYVIIGAPDETRADINKTVDFIREIRPDYLQVSVLTPMPKTELYNRLLESGDIKRDYWQEFAEQPEPNFNPPTCSNYFTRHELIDMQGKIQRRFYFAPRRLISEIRRTKPRQLVKKIKLALSLIK